MQHRHLLDIARFENPVNLETKMIDWDALLPSNLCFLIVRKQDRISVNKERYAAIWIEVEYWALENK